VPGGCPGAGIGAGDLIMGGVVRAFVGVAVTDVLLVVVLAVSHPGFWRQPGALAYLVPVLVMLAVYVAGAVVVVVRPELAPLASLRAGGAAGLVLGGVEVVNIAVETFSGLTGTTNLAVTAPLILGPFVVWGWVAACQARRVATVRAGLTAAYAVAMVTMLVGVTFGLVLVALDPERVARALVGDPDFARSGWTDVNAFALANTFDNAFTHLLGALVVATVVGGIGTALGLRQRHGQAPGGPL